MTHREKVIKELEEISDYFFSVYHHSKDREEINEAKDRCDAVEDALELLKEQEPVKPVVNQDEWVCGCCGTWLERQRMIHPGAILHDLCEYCPACGKKVDWEAVKQDG